MVKIKLFARKKRVYEEKVFTLWCEAPKRGASGTSQKVPQGKSHSAVTYLPMYCSI